jgi:uncharacterized membrane protein YdbT with pleckstrin-like domain
MAEQSRIVIPKVWRSEIRSLIAFIVFAGGSLFLTEKFPQSVITGELFSIGSMRASLTLPLFSLLPVIPLLIGILRIYNVRYVLDKNGLEARVGILGLNQKTTRVRYTDIRSAESDQTLLERFLNIGDVEVGTAATSQIEIIFSGVSAPQKLQTVIQRERDRGLETAHAA